MSRGKRYSNEGQLNYGKVFAVIIAIIVIIMFVFIIKKAVTVGNKNTDKNKKVDYYALYTDNAWGVIDSTGKNIIDPMYKEMIIVIDNSKDVFLCTYDVNEETGEYKTKVINKNNKEIYTGYDKVEALENYDKNSNMWYEKDVLRVQKNGKYGLIDIDGKKVLNTEYDKIETLKGVQNSLIVEKNGLKGLVNNSGVTIINPNYKNITNLGDDYKKGYITVDSNDKYGIVNYSGVQLLENKYDKVEKIYGEKYFVVKEDNKQKVIDSKGEAVITKGFDEIKQIANSGVIFKKDNKYGLMGYDGKVKIEAKYNNLKEINTDIFAAKTNKKYGIIDADNKEKLNFEYQDIYYNTVAGIYVAENDEYKSSILDTDFNIKITGILSEINTDKGYMKLNIDGEYKYYNFKLEEKNETEINADKTLFLSKKDGKYGFVDKDGKTVVDYTYDDATEQNAYGYVAVKKDGLWGSLNKEGKVVIEPTYDLNKNLLVDFIGKWHLGQDLNMNYYCDK